MTERLYLDHPYQDEFTAEVVASASGWCALSRTTFYLGGGGQPPDRGESRWPEPRCRCQECARRTDAYGTRWGAISPPARRRRAPWTGRTGTPSCAIMA